METIDILGDIPALDYDEALASGLIKIVGPELDERFLEKVLGQSVRRGPPPPPRLK
jgi:hypothetical protein